VRIGRYYLFDVLGAGGMGSVHLARQVGDAGFGRTVAIKRLHPQLAADAALVARLLDEGRLVSRVRHANVVATLDVVTSENEACLVMELVQGESLAKLLRDLAQAEERVPVRIAVAILAGMLAGLHAAHEARAEDGTPLAIVHRDVSPKNVIVGADGVTRVLDFGVAHASQREADTTDEGSVRGTLAYMAPEQLRALPVDRRADLFGCGVIAWEMLTGQRLFARADKAATIAAVLEAPVAPPSEVRGGYPGLDAIVLRALSRDPSERWASAEEMLRAIEGNMSPASSREVADWIRETSGPALDARAAQIGAVERAVMPRTTSAPPPAPSAAPSAGRRWTALAVALSVLALAAAALALVPRREAPARAEPPPPPPAPSVAASEPPPIASAAPSVAPDPPEPRRPTRKTSPHRPRPSAAPTSTCDPPFQMGPHGVPVLKEGCS
jgi:serine/threonine-protein kinase